MEEPSACIALPPTAITEWFSSDVDVSDVTKINREEKEEKGVKYYER